jgi:hypothetical protein
MLLRCLALTIALQLLTTWCGTAVGDRFELRDGGWVEGELLERTVAHDYVIRTSAGATVTIGRREVTRIERQDERTAEYLRRSRTMPDTVEAHRELAQWCREQRLVKEREHHLARVLEFAPDDEEARLGLGYQRREGRWLTRAELMAARGMRMYEGKYRTAQEIALRQRREQTEAAQAEWFTTLRLWRDWLDSRRSDHVDKARANIASLNDPRATSAVVRLMKDEKDPWVFQQWVAVLGRLDHPLAIQTLVALTLEDEDPDVRLQALDLLTRDGNTVSLIPYVHALKSRDNQVVNRAAVALAQIGNPRAVSPLIDALVTRHDYLIPGGSAGQINAGMTNGSGSFSAGGEGPKIVKRQHENYEVHRALLKLASTHDLGYDERAWRNWFVLEQNRERIKSRRDD